MCRLSCQPAIVHECVITVVDDTYCLIAYDFFLSLLFFPSISFIIIYFFFFLNDTPPTEISPLPLHDALPIFFGPPTRRWNPKMKEYIYGERNGIYIIDLQKTLKYFKDAARFVSDLAREGRTILFVGTKRQIGRAHV